MIHDKYIQIRIDSLLEKYFENELRFFEVRLKLAALNIPLSTVDDLINSTRDAKRDIERGVFFNAKED